MTFLHSLITPQSDKLNQKQQGTTNTSATVAKMTFWNRVIEAWKGESAPKKEEPHYENHGKKYDFDDMVELVKSKPENTLLIDVREPNEFSIVQIPCSYNMPYKSCPDALSYDEEEFESKFGFPKPGKDKELVFFCAAGRRAEGAQAKAVSKGYTNSSIYPGSTNDWVSKHGDKIQF